MKKTIFITGSTDGIGKLAALKLAKDGHKIFLHGRNAAKTEEVLKELRDESGNSEIEGFVSDFSDFKEVNTLAEEVKNRVDSLDVLINNAGVFKSTVSKSKQGLDLRFAVNYFAPYILTKELLPLLQENESSRLINLSSAAQSSVTLGSLRGEQDLGQSSAYAQSKLALTMWSFDLAQSVSKPAVIAVNPGSLLNTNMVKEGYGYHWSSADKGADILYDLAVSEEHAGITGKYFDNDKGSYGNAHADAYAKDKINSLLKATEEILQQKLG